MYLHVYVFIQILCTNIYTYDDKLVKISYVYDNTYEMNEKNISISICSKTYTYISTYAAFTSYPNLTFNFHKII